LGTLRPFGSVLFCLYKQNQERKEKAMSKNNKKNQEENILEKKLYRWLITINNPKEKGIEFLNIPEIINKKWKRVIYFCCSFEIGIENKTPHIHIYIYFKSQIAATSILKTFKGAHLDNPEGTHIQCRDYIFKNDAYFERRPDKKGKVDTKQEGMQYESGECPEEEQGKRNDLDQLKDLIREGKTNNEIYEVNSSYMRFAGSLDKMRLDILGDKFGKEWRTIETAYVMGDTGSGKTRNIMDGFGYTNVCRVRKDDYGFNNYVAQDVVVFEEFRNTFQLTDMLDYLDGYPTDGRALYGKRQLGFTKVFICSNWDLQEQYRNIQVEHPKDWQAFLRRIHKVIIRKKSGDTIFYQKNIGTEDNPEFDYFTEDGVSYFDPFGLRKRNPEDLDAWEVVGENIEWEDI